MESYLISFICLLTLLTVLSTTCSHPTSAPPPVEYPPSKVVDDGIISEGYSDFIESAKKELAKNQRLFHHHHHHGHHHSPFGHYRDYSIVDRLIDAIFGFNRNWGYSYGPYTYYYGAMKPERLENAKNPLGSLFGEVSEGGTADEVKVEKKAKKDYKMKT